MVTKFGWTLKSVFPEVMVMVSVSINLFHVFSKISVLNFPTSVR